MRRTKIQEEYQLITQKHPKAPVAEAYRTLRTNLGFADMDNPPRSIMVSSTDPQDGKSTVVANLAVVMAQTGKKVLLVDCDLRKPVQHRIFHVENHRGFTNCLVQKLDVKGVVHEGLAGNLSLLSSGPVPPNPAEILASEQVRKLWPVLLKEYDYVFIDSPPLLAVADASIIAAQVDGVLLVVRSAATRIDLAREAKSQILKANARLLGVVLNQVKVNRHNYQYYYYAAEN